MFFLLIKNTEIQSENNENSLNCLSRKTMDIINSEIYSENMKNAKI